MNQAAGRELAHPYARRLETYRRLGYGWAEGYRHQTRRELRIKEARGVLAPLWTLEKELPGGVVNIPYRRLISESRERRELWTRRLVYAGAGLVILGALGTVVWLTRIPLLALLILGGLVAYTVRHLGRHWRRGCSGLHCSGCRG